MQQIISDCFNNNSSAEKYVIMTTRLYRGFQIAQLGILTIRKGILSRIHI